MTSEMKAYINWNGHRTFKFSWNCISKAWCHW